MESEEPVGDDICKDADAVYALVLYRFGQHFIEKSCEDKKEHFAFQWAGRNLSRVVAMMAYFGHIKQGIGSLSTTAQDCLLAIHNAGRYGGTFLDARAEGNKNLEGNYLYFDLRNYKWIRSGKVSGTNVNFGTRDAQHASSSKNPTNSDITFHKLYPDESVTTLSQRGKFQQLEQRCGLAFLRGTTDELTNQDGHTILDWDPATVSRLDGKSKSKGVTLQHLQLDMAAYQFEFVSALCIGADNVSVSWGFENMVGTHR